MNGAVALGPTWDRIRAALASLHPGQRRVAEVLLGMGSQELARASASEIAVLSETSPATVVRTCQQLGFAGFRECALLLALDVGSVAAPLGESGAGAAVAGARHYLGEVAAAVLHAASTIDEAMVDDVAAEIVGAGRTLVVAYGWSAGAAGTFALNLSALGRTVEAPTDAQAQLVAAQHLAPGDVCIVVCFTGSHRHAELVARVAREQGATVIVVSTFSGSLAARHAARNLIFGDTLAGLPTASVVQFATLEAIRVAVAARLGVTPSTGFSSAMPTLVEDGVDR